MMRMIFFIIERQSRLDVLDSIGQCSSAPAHRPGGVVCLQLYVSTTELVRDSKKIVRNPLRSVEPAIGVVEHPQIGNRRSEFFRALELAPDAGGAFDDIPHFGGRPAMNAHQGGAKLRQNSEL